VKSWIRIRIKVKIQELSRLNMEPWRAVDAQNGGVCITFMRRRIQIRIRILIEVNSRIRIRIKVKRWIRIRIRIRIKVVDEVVDKTITRNYNMS
jgi:hypothetical protein